MRTVEETVDIPVPQVTARGTFSADVANIRDFRIVRKSQGFEKILRDRVRVENVVGPLPTKLY